MYKFTDLGNHLFLALIALGFSYTLQTVRSTVLISLTRNMGFHWTFCSCCHSQATQWLCSPLGTRLWANKREPSFTSFSMFQLLFAICLISFIFKSPQFSFTEHLHGWQQNFSCDLLGKWTAECFYPVLISEPPVPLNYFNENNNLRRIIVFIYVLVKNVWCHL